MSGEHDYELKMPFLPVASRGGPYDDDAYTAGWEMGALAARLDAARHFGLGLPQVTIHRANVEQADLIAMGVQAETTEGWPDGSELDEQTRSEWAHLTFRWIA